VDVEVVVLQNCPAIVPDLVSLIKCSKSPTTTIATKPTTFWMRLNFHAL
jgi:hypothetical protein